MLPYKYYLYYSACCGKSLNQLVHFGILEQVPYLRRTMESIDPRLRLFEGLPALDERQLLYHRRS